MITLLWIVLFIIAVLLILITAEFETNDYPAHWCIIISLFTTILWFFLAANSLESEEIYTVYNASSGIVESGINIVSSKVSPELMLLCGGIGSAMMLYTSWAFLMLFRELYNKESGEPEHPYDNPPRQNY